MMMLASRAGGRSAAAAIARARPASASPLVPWRRHSGAAGDGAAAAPARRPLSRSAPAAAVASQATAAAAAVPQDCLLPLCAVCLAFWLTSATISACLNFLMQLLGWRRPEQPAYAGGGAGGGAGPGLLAGIGPTRAGSSGGWVAAGVYESDIMRLPLSAYYEVPAEPSAGSGSDDDAKSATSPPPASFVVPLPSSPDDWASAEAGTPFVPARKLQVISPGRLQAGLTTSRTRQFDDLKINLVADGDAEGGDGESGGGSSGGVGGGGGSVDGSSGADRGDGFSGGGSRRPGSGPGDVPPPGGRV